jgi:PST family polysaccharide transporter
MSLVSFPVFVGIAVAAPDVIAAVFGPRWAASVPVMRVLAFFGILHSLFFFNTTVVMSMGRPGLRLAINTLNAAANVAAFALVVRWGIVAVAAAFVVRAYLLSPLPLWAVHSLIDIDLKSYLKRFVAPAAATGVMAAAIAAARVAAQGWVASPWVMVALDVGVGALVYAVTLRALAPRVVKESLHLIGQVLLAGGRRRAAPNNVSGEPPPVEVLPLG